MLFTLLYGLFFHMYTLLQITSRFTIQLFNYYSIYIGEVDMWLTLDVEGHMTKLGSIYYYHLQAFWRSSHICGLPLWLVRNWNCPCFFEVLKGCHPLCHSSFVLVSISPGVRTIDINGWPHTLVHMLWSQQKLIMQCAYQSNQMCPMNH